MGDGDTLGLGGLGGQNRLGGAFVNQEGHGLVHGLDNPVRDDHSPLLLTPSTVEVSVAMSMRLGDDDRGQDAGNDGSRLHDDGSNGGIKKNLLVLPAMSLKEFRGMWKSNLRDLDWNVWLACQVVCVVCVVCVCQGRLGYRNDACASTRYSVKEGVAR